MSSSAVSTVATDAGMLALWRASAFADIDGYDAWERRVNERLGQAIRLAELVPIGIQGDGAFGVRVAVAPDAATQREVRHTVVTSEPYVLVADGGAICLSGIEAVGDERMSPVTVTLPAVRGPGIARSRGRGARCPWTRRAAFARRSPGLPGGHRAQRWVRDLPDR